MSKHYNSAMLSTVGMAALQVRSARRLGTSSGSPQVDLAEHHEGGNVRKLSREEVRHREALWFGGLRVFHRFDGTVLGN